MWHLKNIKYEHLAHNSCKTLVDDSKRKLFRMFERKSALPGNTTTDPLEIFFSHFTNDTRKKSRYLKNPGP